VVVNRKTFERGVLPWPYSLERARIKQAVAGLDESGTSPWLELAAGEGPRRGVLRAYGLDDDTVYLTPVYTRYVKESGAAEPYVGDDPSAVGVSSRIGDYLPRHASDLADTRVATVVASLKAVTPDLVLYVDRSIAIARAASAERPGPGQETTTALAADAQYVAADRRVARLAESAGPNAVVLIVGTRAGTGQNDAVGWFSVATPGGDAQWGRASIDELTATIRYLLSLPATTPTHAVPTIVAAYPTRRSRATVATVADARAVVPLSTTSLRELTPAVVDQDRGAVTATSAP
jgi:hypothetical protein